MLWKTEDSVQSLFWSSLNLFLNFLPQSSLKLSIASVTVSSQALSTLTTFSHVYFWQLSLLSIKNFPQSKGNYFYMKHKTFIVLWKDVSVAGLATDPYCHWHISITTHFYISSKEASTIKNVKYIYCCDLLNDYSADFLDGMGFLHNGCKIPECSVVIIKCSEVTRSNDEYWNKKLKDLCRGGGEQTAEQIWALNCCCMSYSLSIDRDMELWEMSETRKWENHVYERNLNEQKTFLRSIIVPFIGNHHNFSLYYMNIMWHLLPFLSHQLRLYYLKMWIYEKPQTPPFWPFYPEVFD